MSLEDPVTARRLRGDVYRLRARPAATPPRALGSHHLHALRRDALLRRDPLPHREPLSEAAEEPLLDEGPSTATVHWIEIAVVDDDGVAYPDLRYEAKLPDGTVRRGRLSRQGTVRFDRIAEAGSVELTFPDLHHDAWKPA